MSDFAPYVAQLENLESQVMHLREENRRLREVVEFYAGIGQVGTPIDGGARAREVLSNG